ncbi:thermonuclease family protein [Nocardioides sp. WS12]|uniref:thermonuclease family protein n=1 Tax=Nocardioides sp. WS12 TaxID=2486272 RepID=UPI0015FE7D1D|nr:thermonuclease family protein [Nocardioides sp. WS12]
MRRHPLLVAVAVVVLVFVLFRVFDGANAQPHNEVQQVEPKDGRSLVVTHVVDGDTVDLSNGETVRLVGIDTPERGECGYREARSALVDLVEDKRITLGASDEDRDRYDRLLRYVDVGNVDAGLQLIKQGLAIARYDSRDGYGRHPREDRYLKADKASPPSVCD